VSKRNVAKIDTLECVYDLGFATSTDISQIREISLHCASMRLKRAYRQGLLTREKNGKHYYYEINSKGINRLAYLKKRKRKTEEKKDVPNYSAPPIQLWPPVKSQREGKQAKQVNVFQSKKRCKVKKDYTNEQKNQVTEDDINDSDIEDYFRNVEKCEVRRDNGKEKKSQQEEKDIERLFKRLSKERCEIKPESE
jgi:hypothetical protein